MDNGPGQDQTMGMSMTGSGDMEGQQMDWTTVDVYSPDGSYNSMELDLGMLVWSQSKIITSAADGTTLIQVNHNGAQMLMNSATNFSSWNNDNMDTGDDNDMAMADNSDMLISEEDGSEMSLPIVEVPDSFDPSDALFEAGLATDNGYSFSTTMDEGMGYSMTMTFTLGMDLVVNSMTLTETMDDESSTSSITMLEESTIMGYLTIDSTLPYQALPYTVSPIGGMDDNSDDNGDDGVEWESYNGGYCEWEGDSGDKEDVWFCKYDESDNYWDTWWYYCELHDGDWHCTDDLGQSSENENSADLERYDADEGHDNGHDDNGDDGHEEENMACYDTIMEEYDYVRDQTDCEDNGFIWMNLDDDHNENGIYDDEEFICDNGNIINIDLVNNQIDDCGDGSDESHSDDQGDHESWPQSIVDDLNGIFDNNDADMSGDLDVNELDQFILEIDEYFMSMDDNGDGPMFTCDNGNEIPEDYFDDGDNDCGDWSDEPNHNDNGDDEMDDNGDDNHEQMWTFEREMSECDSDADGMVDYDELDACVTNDLLNDGYGDEEILDFYGGWFDWFDADGDGMLDSNEFNDFAEMTSEGPMMVCYSVNSDEVDLSITSEEYCDYANTIWTEALQPVNDGDDGMDDNGDGHDDHGDHGSMFDWMISETQDMPMEGSFDDYTITLAMCTMDDSNDDGMDMGMGTTPTMDCSDDVLIVTIADAMTQDAVVMFHDVDMSGTISQGDMVHINPDIDADGWNTVRLYSTSANSYSDENPMLTLGFTGALGMLALLGAALLTRRD
jgi:hypothetical protein